MKVNRYFGGMVKTQANWLNQQAKSGWRLISTGKLSYEFEPCQAGEYQYCVEYVGHLSLSESYAYKQFLEEMGYRVWYKNINLQWSVGKVQYRPWANKGGRIVTNSTTIDKELMIIEKRNDGTAFVLHTTIEDRIRIARRHRDPWLWIFLFFIVFALLFQNYAFCALAALCAIPAFVFHWELRALKKESLIEE